MFVALSLSISFSALAEADTKLDYAVRLWQSCIEEGAIASTNLNEPPSVLVDFVTARCRWQKSQVTDAIASIGAAFSIQPHDDRVESLQRSFSADTLHAPLNAIGAARYRCIHGLSQDNQDDVPVDATNFATAPACDWTRQNSENR